MSASGEQVVAVDGVQHRANPVARCGTWWTTRSVCATRHGASPCRQPPPDAIIDELTQGILHGFLHRGP